MIIFGINFCSIHARDFPQQEGFGRGGIKDCFLPLEESVFKFDLQRRGLRKNSGYLRNRGISAYSGRRI